MLQGSLVESSDQVLGPPPGGLRRWATPDSDPGDTYDPEMDHSAGPLLDPIEPPVLPILPAAATEGRKYSYTIDFDNPNSVHALAVSATPVGSLVLDVGCADGSLAAALVQRGARVVGIDIDTVALDHARASLLSGFVVDLDGDLDRSMELIEGACGPDKEGYDCIIALDVLEHLKDPDVVLRELADRCLAPHGRVILSIPNIAHASVRLSLLDGEFDYREKGLLDTTHLRFFTHSTVGQLLQRAGLVELASAQVTLDADQTEIPVDLLSYPPEVLQRVHADPYATTYQFFIIAGKQGAPPPASTEFATLSRQPAFHAEPPSPTLAVDSHETDELSRQLIETQLQLSASLSELATVRAEVAQLQVLQRRLFEIERSETWFIGYVVTHPLRLVRKWVRAWRASG